MADSRESPLGPGRPSKHFIFNLFYGLSLTALAVFFFGLLFPHLQAQFIADDFVFLVEDAHRPWYYSSDFLYRPLRNLVNRLLPHLLGLSPLGYRILATVSVLATLVLFFMLLRQFGVSKEGSLAAVLIAAFYPRHAMVYYFWAASQDSFMTLLLILSFVFWIRFRRGGLASDYWIALVSYAAGLGFKEPAICFPALLLGWDLLRLGDRWRECLRPSSWRPYVGIVCIVAVFGLFVLWYPEGRLYKPDRYATYGFFGIRKGAFAWIRTWANLLLPFSMPLGLRDLKISDAAVLGLIGCATFALQRWLRVGMAFFLCVAGISLMNIPTSVFASTNAGDQYLYLPSFFIAGFLGVAIGAALDKSTGWKTLSVAALTIYLLCSAIYIKGRQVEWAEGGEYARTMVSKIRGVVPPEGLRELTIIGLVGEHHGMVIFNNGTLGALVATGYSPDLQVAQTGIDNTPLTQRLIEQSLPCRTEAPQTGARRILIVIDDRPTELELGCAGPIIAADRTSRAWAWQ